MSNSYSEELRELSEAAEGGDCDAGERLLALFASLADDSHDPHPELVRHMARCVRRYVNLEARERRDGGPMSCDATPRHFLSRSGPAGSRKHTSPGGNGKMPQPGRTAKMS